MQSGAYIFILVNKARYLLLNTHYRARS